MIENENCCGLCTKQEIVEEFDVDVVRDFFHTTLNNFLDNEENSSKVND